MLTTFCGNPVVAPAAQAYHRLQISYPFGIKGNSQRSLSGLQNRRAACGGKRGFTLMEMIIVLTIIALLMGLVIMNLGGIGQVAQIKKTQADILAFKEALSTYQLQTGTLPTTDQGLKALWAKPTTEPVPDQWHKIMDSEVLDPWGHSYQYQNPGKHNTDGYDVYSMGPDGQAGTDDDIGNWKK